MPVWYVHGRHDLLAMPKFAERLADRFGSPCVLVNGGHFIPRENSYEVSRVSIIHFCSQAVYPGMTCQKHWKSGWSGSALAL
jgi:hypothetical protein